MGTYVFMDNFIVDQRVYAARGGSDSPGGLGWLDSVSEIYEVFCVICDQERIVRIDFFV